MDRNNVEDTWHQLLTLGPVVKRWRHTRGMATGNTNVALAWALQRNEYGTENRQLWCGDMGRVGQG